MTNTAKQIEISRGGQVATKPIKKRKRRAKSARPEYIVDYGNFLLQRNYSPTTVEKHLARMKAVQSFIEVQLQTGISSIEDFKALQKGHLINYEEFLIYRMSKREIKEETAYCNLKNVRLFIQFLHYKKVINFQYTIPKKFIVQTNRLNTYIPNDILKKLINGTASMSSRFLRLRAIAILLLIIDTGCRPIEVCSLDLNDIKISERKIRLFSIKSGQRTLKVNEFVIKCLKSYIKERKGLNPTTNNLFLTSNGDPLKSRDITMVISKLNMEVFGEVLVNSRAIRHTFITNAIDNNNDLVEISESVGHKHWESTLYYLHQNKKRLLLNTLEFNPINKSMEE